MGLLEPHVRRDRRVGQNTLNMSDMVPWVIGGLALVVIAGSVFWPVRSKGGLEAGSTVHHGDDGSGGDSGGGDGGGGD